MLKTDDDIKSVILLLLDWLAALDTLRLVNNFGVRDSVLYWFRSCLQFFLLMVLNRHWSVCNTEHHGSVLGPLLYSLYISLLGDIAWKADYIAFHLYVDDTQLHLLFTFNCPNHIISSKSQLSYVFSILATSSVHDLPLITSKSQRMLPFQVLNLPGI